MYPLPHIKRDKKVRRDTMNLPRQNFDAFAFSKAPDYREPKVRRKTAGEK
tara:strand:- start:2631 stop:2780 length:150 start_codon:yes stop_codon:yes gene_type:complete